MSRQLSTSAGGNLSQNIGQAFNPFRLFTGIVIPEAMVPAKSHCASEELTSLLDILAQRANASRRFYAVRGALGST